MVKPHLEITWETPCNGCYQCCINDSILLHEECGDNPDDYETDLIDGKHYLKIRPNGDCWYLDINKGGCTIHDTKPCSCKNFDCRVFLLKGRDFCENMVKNKKINPRVLIAAAGLWVSTSKKEKKKIINLYIQNDINRIELLKQASEENRKEVKVNE